MFTDEFVKANCQECVYQLKEGTSTSFYRKEGSTILPKRISLSKQDMSKTKRTGRNSYSKSAGQMVSAFTANEDSPYKLFHPYRCRTKIWSQEQFPLFVGYGTVGISDKNGQAKDNGDLLIFYTPDSWHTMRIFIFSDMAVPDAILQAFKYANSVILLDR